MKKEHQSNDILYTEITFLPLLDWVGWESKQAGPSHLHDITLPDIITFPALAQQMGHDMTEKLQDSWSRLG